MLAGAFGSHQHFISSGSAFPFYLIILSSPLIAQLLHTLNFTSFKKINSPIPSGIIYMWNPPHTDTHLHLVYVLNCGWETVAQFHIKIRINVSQICKTRASASHILIWMQVERTTRKIIQHIGFNQKMLWLWAYSEQSKCQSIDIVCYTGDR